MPWSGAAGSQTFARTDGTRSGSQTWQQADAAGVDIVAPDHDTHDQDIATGLNATLKKDGGNAATSNIPMGGFTLTNLAAATARTMPARFSDLQDGKGVYVPTVGGTANAITLTTGYTVTAYAAGQSFKFIAASTNSGATTINVDALGVKDVYVGGSAISAGMISAGMIITVTYDGTRFQMQAEAPAAISVGTVMAWPSATVPTGWLECDGTAVSRSTYSALFAVLSTAYGVGDGSTTFNLPNYTDYFLRGYSASATDGAARTDRGDGTTGIAVGTKQAAGTLPHTHTFTTDSGGTHDHSATYNLDGITAGGGQRVTSIQSSGGSQAWSVASGGAHTHTGTTAASSGSNTETRPKNILVKWIILAIPGAALAFGVSSASTTDNALARFDGTGGTIQNSGVIVDDSNNVTGIAGLTATSLTPTSIELGHATDTTLTRTGAGDIAIEGNAVYRASGTDVPVADGGSGRSTATAYAVLCGGITATAAHQSIASAGTSGQVLVSNGAAALPTFQTVAGTGDVVGPASATDNAVARYDLTTGKLVQNSGVIIDDTNDVTGMNSLTLTNTGLHLLDTNASHDLIIAPGSDLTADRTLTLTTGDSARTVTISGNATISQDYSTTGNPQFATIELGAATDTTISRSEAGVIAVEGVPLFSGMPQNSQSTAYTLVLSDAQKHILHPTADNNARTFTIPANASVAYPIGTVITFINQINTVTIAITSDTLTFAGSGSTGSRTLAASGMATAVKVTSTLWFISGVGLT